MGEEEMEIPKLGIIAAVQLDGSVSFYPVPHPKFLVSEQSVVGQPVYRTSLGSYQLFFTAMFVAYIAFLMV